MASTLRAALSLAALAAGGSALSFSPLGTQDVCGPKFVGFEHLHEYFPRNCVVYCVPEGPCVEKARDGPVRDKLQLKGEGNCKQRGFNQSVELGPVAEKLADGVKDAQGVCRGMKILRFKKPSESAKDEPAMEMSSNFFPAPETTEPAAGMPSYFFPAPDNTEPAAETPSDFYPAPKKTEPATGMPSNFFPAPDNTEPAAEPPADVAPVPETTEPAAGMPSNFFPAPENTEPAEEPPADVAPAPETTEPATGMPSNFFPAPENTEPAAETPADVAPAPEKTEPAAGTPADIAPAPEKTEPAAETPAEAEPATPPAATEPALVPVRRTPVTPRVRFCEAGSTAFRAITRDRVRWARPSHSTCTVYCVPEGRCQGMAQAGRLLHLNISGEGTCQGTNYTEPAEPTREMSHYIQTLAGPCKGMTMRSFRAPMPPHEQSIQQDGRVCGPDAMAYETINPLYPNACGVYCVPKGKCEGLVQSGNLKLGITQQGNCRGQGFTEPAGSYGAASEAAFDVARSFKGPCKGMTYAKFEKQQAV